jgi:hypothetical protein
MATEIVNIHGRLFARFEPPFDPITVDETHCISQTCGTIDGIAQAQWEYPDPTPEEVEAQAQWEREFQAEKRAGREAKKRVERLKLEIARKKMDLEAAEELAGRQRGWARDAMHCGLPNPFPEAFR